MGQNIFMYTFSNHSLFLYLKQYFSNVVFYILILLCNCLYSGEDVYKLQSLLSNPIVYLLC